MAGLGGQRVALGLGRRRAVVVQPPEAQEEQVAGLEPAALAFGRGDDVGDRDRLARPVVDRPPLRLAVPGDVDEHPAADDPVLGPALHAQQRVAGHQALAGRAVVEAVVGVPEVAQPVDLRGDLREDVVEVLVAVERVAAEDGVPDGAPCGGQRWVQRVHRLVEVDHLAGAHARGPSQAPVGREPPDRAQLVVGAILAPGRSRRAVGAVEQFAVAAHASILAHREARRSDMQTSVRGNGWSRCAGTNMAA